MKKILNFLGIIGSIILTLILTNLISSYVVILNLKSLVSENGLANTLKQADIVEMIETNEDSTLKEDLNQLAESLNLTEEQFEQIINNDKVKEQVGKYISEVLSASLSDKEVYLTKEDIETFFNVAVDEYNKISETKISEEDRKELIESFDEEMIGNMNEEFASINLTETVAPEYVEYIKLANSIIFGNYSLIIMGLIIATIVLIALFRFSYYKWMPFVSVSTILNGITMLLIGILLFIVPLQELEIISPIKNLIATRVLITSGILFAISIILIVLYNILKKNKANTITNNN